MDIKYITLTGKSAPRSDNNIYKFEAVTAIIKNKDTGKYLALEFINNEFGLVGGKIEKNESRREAILREIEEETGYKNADIKGIIFEKIYSRGYKSRKDREEEALDKVYYVEVEDVNKGIVEGADYGIENIHWFTKDEMLDKLTLDHHLYFFKEFLDVEFSFL